ncbi:MAG: hypothetical protein V4850_35605 [Myxococcota bacterium]
MLAGAWLDDPGGSNSGAAYLFYGPLAGALDTTDADATFNGASADDYVGTGVALGDLDADGFLEVVLGAPGLDAGALEGGGAYVQAPL